ncbi:MAG: 6-carboxytetrahydropterin synthase [Candidatus Zixiibacteriota bacterium]|nr:MAG: 6-carboxytetrahydropterin synthase [candidate division Zixibacteria bacterium]
MVIEVSGEVDESTGFLMDYADIKKAADPFIKQLDHSHLNDIADLPLATTEYIARWLWERIKPALPQLSAVTICETPRTCCEYRGE